MCQQAYPFQQQRMAGRRYGFGDFVYANKQFHVCVDGNSIENIRESISMDDSACPHKFKKWWIPRQDQIQAMLLIENPTWGESTTEPDCLLGALDRWIKDCGDEYYSTLNTMEKLWMAFYMSSELGKTWDGKEWSEYCRKCDDNPGKDGSKKRIRCPKDARCPKQPGI